MNYRVRLTLRLVIKGFIARFLGKIERVVFVSTRKADSLGVWGKILNTFCPNVYFLVILIVLEVLVNVYGT